MVYTVCAHVHDRTNKPGNTSSTWREEPVDFQFGKDANLERRYYPNLTLYSKKLIKIMELLLDYYPSHLGDFDHYSSDQDIFKEFMYYYPELKAYIKTYLRILPKDQPQDPRLDIGNCGDE